MTSTSHGPAPDLIHRSDEELVPLIVAGQEEVFSIVYDRQYGRIYRLVFGMLGRHEGADDVTQEIFLRAFLKLAQFDGRAQFSTWLYRLAVNHCLNQVSTIQREDQMYESDQDLPELTGDLPSAESLILQHQIQHQVTQALLSLKPHYRIVILLRDIEGFRYEDIAEQLNCSVGTLAARLKRARMLLARKLEHLKGMV